MTRNQQKISKELKDRIQKIKESNQGYNFYAYNHNGDFVLDINDKVQIKGSSEEELIKNLENYLNPYSIADELRRARRDGPAFKVKSRVKREEPQRTNAAAETRKQVIEGLVQGRDKHGQVKALINCLFFKKNTNNRTAVAVSKDGDTHKSKQKWPKVRIDTDNNTINIYHKDRMNLHPILKKIKGKSIDEAIGILKDEAIKQDGRQQYAVTEKQQAQDKEPNQKSFGQIVVAGTGNEMMGQGNQLAGGSHSIMDSLKLEKKGETLLLTAEPRVFLGLIRTGLKINSRIMQQKIRNLLGNFNNRDLTALSNTLGVSTKLLENGSSSEIVALLGTYNEERLQKIMDDSPTFTLRLSEKDEGFLLSVLSQSPVNIDCRNMSQGFVNALTDGQKPLLEGSSQLAIGPKGPNLSSESSNLPKNVSLNGQKRDDMRDSLLEKEEPQRTNAAVNVQSTVRDNKAEAAAETRKQVIEGLVQGRDKHGQVKALINCLFFKKNTNNRTAVAVSKDGDTHKPKQKWPKVRIDTDNNTINIYHKDRMNLHPILKKIKGKSIDEAIGILKDEAIKQDGRQQYAVTEKQQAQDKEPNQESSGQIVDGGTGKARKVHEKPQRTNAAVEIQRGVKDQQAKISLIQAFESSNLPNNVSPNGQRDGVRDSLLEKGGQSIQESKTPSLERLVDQFIELTEPKWLTNASSNTSRLFSSGMVNGVLRPEKEVLEARSRHNEYVTKAYVEKMQRTFSYIESFAEADRKNSGGDIIQSVINEVEKINQSTDPNMNMKQLDKLLDQYRQKLEGLMEKNQRVFDEYVPKLTALTKSKIFGSDVINALKVALVGALSLSIAILSTVGAAAHITLDFAVTLSIAVITSALSAFVGSLLFVVKQAPGMAPVIGESDRKLINAAKDCIKTGSEHVQNVINEYSENIKKTTEEHTDNMEDLKDKIQKQKETLQHLAPSQESQELKGISDCFDIDSNGLSL